MIASEAPKRIRDNQGNLVSMEQIYDTYFDDIFRYILYRVGSVEDAEDICAQTFYKALKNLWRFRWTGVPISAWLYRIGTNEIHNFLRRMQKDRLTPVEDDFFNGQAATGQPDTELANAQAEYNRYQVFRQLADCVRELKPIDQTLVTLRYLEQKSYREIGQIVGKREGAVTMRTHRALEKLRNRLQKRGIRHDTIRESFEEPGQATGGSPGIQAEFAP